MDFILSPANMQPTDPEFAKATEYVSLAFNLNCAGEGLYTCSINGNLYHITEDNNKWYAGQNGVLIAEGNFLLEAVYKLIWPECRVLAVSASELLVGDMLALSPFEIIASEPLPALQVLVSKGILDIISEGIDSSCGTADNPSPELLVYMNLQKDVLDYLRKPLDQDTVNYLFGALRVEGVYDGEVPVLADTQIDIDYMQDLTSVLRFDSLSDIFEVEDRIEASSDVYDFQMSADDKSKVWVVRR